MHWSDESLALLPPEVDDERVRDLGLNVLGGDLLFPVLLLKDSALQHNIELMARYCAEHGLSLAPHAKVTMAPRIIRRQVDAGAWAVCAAAVSQLRVLRSNSFERLFLVNELVQPAAIRWVVGELEADPNFEFFCLVDSSEGVEMLSDVVASAGASRRLEVLIEIGISGGRAGCRTREDALSVARSVRKAKSLRLVGVEGFESVVEHNQPDDVLAAVDAFLSHVKSVVEYLANAGAFDGLEEVIVSAGGSTYLDRVAHFLSDWDIGPPVRTVVRGGAYVTHDAGFNAQMSPLAGRSGGGQQLQEAVEVWGSVLSRPEPALAIAGFGKRDAPHCEGLPRVRSVYRRFGGLAAAPGSLQVERLNDQHAYLALSPNTELGPGDLVGCSISNPCCPGFQKWRVVPLVGDAYDVIGVVRSFP
jgi:D-serine dehydratase